MNDYITKPIEPMLLFSVIAKWTRGKLSLDLPAPAAAVPEVPEMMINGVNTAAALRRVNNDTHVYLNLLEKFINNHEPDLENIKVLTEQQSWKELREKTHSMRGAALNLGAEELGQVLTLIEKAALNKDAQQMNKYLKLAQKSFNAICKDLNKLKQRTENIPAEQTSQRFDKKALEAQIKSLLQKVKNHDPAAKTLMKEINQTVSADQFGGALVKAQVLSGHV